MIIDSIEKLHSLPEKDFLIIPFFSDDTFHYLNNELCGILISELELDSNYIITFNHNECINLDYESVFNYISQLNCRKFVLNKKSILKYIPTFNSNFFDIESIYYIYKNCAISNLDGKINLTYKTESEKNIKLAFPNIKYINRYIPIYKILDRIHKNLQPLKELIINNPLSVDNLQYYKFLEKSISSFHDIESNGIYIDKDKLLKFFPEYSSYVNNNLIYSDYNIYTTTGRPSNTFNKLNFAAMNKDDGTREMITSRHGSDGIILMFDYDAYHLAIISKIVNYNFPAGVGIHEYLGRIYYGKDVLTEEEYKKSKEISFQILYGGIDDSVAKEIEFFGKVKSFITKMHVSYNTHGYVESPISKKRFYKENFGEMNENKIFNYMLQELETSRNINVIQNLNNVLKNTNSKLVLYLYDAFVFDFYLPDGKELLNEIKNVMEDNNIYKTKIEYGQNLHNMKKMT